MKYALLFFVLISFSIISVKAQKGGLLVTKYKNQKSKFITEDSKVRIKSGGKTLKGRFTILSDSTILVQTDTILLTQISEVRFQKVATQFGGGLLLLAGAYLTAGGIFGVATIAAEGGVGSGALLIGLFIFSPLYVGGAFIAATGILLLVKGKKFTSSNWKYKIVRPIPVPYSN